MQSLRVLLLAGLTVVQPLSLTLKVRAEAAPTDPKKNELSGITRLSAHPASVAAASARLGPTVEPLAQCSRLTSLVISEIMYHPPERADGKKLEFIELFNSADTPEDISGYRLSGDVDYTFPANTVLSGRGFLVVAGRPDDVQSVYGLTGVLGPFNKINSLPNDAGTIQLRNPVGAVFLEIQYRNQPPWPVAAAGAGHSLVLARPSLGENDPRAWSASDSMGGSPGQPDPVTSGPLRSVLINEFLAHTDLPDLDYVELYNQSNESVDLSGCVLTDNPSTNRFVLPPNTQLPPRGFLSFDESQLHFALSAAGETIYLKDPSQSRVLDAVRFEAQENGVSMGRYPDGGDQFYRLQSKSPGAPNASVRVSDLVINELMYAPISGLADDQYVEIYNHGAAPADLSGWRLEDGVSFTFPPGTMLSPDGYLVVAKNVARLLTNYPNLTPSIALGDFQGKLAGGGERIALTKPDTLVSTNLDGSFSTNLIHIVVDEVTYQNGGRWGQWAHGGGSSLERIDPRADGRLAGNWADSDETAKAPWTTVSFKGRLDNGSVAADQLQVLLQGAGECLIDDVQLLNAQGVNLLVNSDFESDASGWTAEGTEDQSGWEAAEGYNSAHCYHVRAVDRGDNEVNRVRTPVSPALAGNSTATIQAKVRWLKGAPGVLFRLRGNWLEALGAMELPKNPGTPGARNSRAVPNGPPAIYGVGHAPILPGGGEAVVVTARVSDPDGITSMVLRYRVDPDTAYQNVAMVDDGTGGDAVAGDGVYSATIPGQSTGRLTAFYIQAWDAATSIATATFPDDAPRRECLVRFGETTPAGDFPVYRLWMTQSTFNTWTSRNKMNNTPLDITFVLGDQRVIYNTLALYAGSPYIAPGYSTPSGNRCGYSVTFPSDDRFLGNLDLVLDWPGGHGNENTALQEQMGYWIANKIGLPYSHRYTIRLHVNGVTDMKRGGVFEAVNQPAGDFVRAWSPDDSTGDFYKIERAFEFSDGGNLSADPEPRLQNYTTVGGAKKTARYRWNWLKRSTDDVNDYTNVFNLVDAVNAASPEPYTSQTEALVDLEEWMGMLAVEHIIANFDAYGHEIGKNMYGYKPDHGKWQLYMFDLDWLMLAALNHGSSYSPSSAPLFNADDPVIVRMYNHPPFLRAYYRAVKKAVEGPLLSANCDPVMDAKYAALVANGVTQCDGQKLAAPTAVKNWFSQRHDALAAKLGTLAASFAVTGNNGSELVTNADAMTLAGTAPIEVKGILVNGQDYPVTWTTVTNWALRLALAPGPNDFTLVATDTSGNALTNYTSSIKVNFTGSDESPEGQVVINEIMYRPSAPNGQFIELFNRSADLSFDLSGWRLQGVDFTFPGGTVLGPGGYAVVAKDRAAFGAAYGTGIPLVGEYAGTLSPGGETLSLIKPGAAPDQDLVVSTVSYQAGPPWPATIDGSSLQLIDPAQENSRVANWTAVSSNTNTPSAPQWQYVTATGTATTSRLYIYMASAGDVEIDDLMLVAGSVPGAGQNLVPDGDFESGFPGPWSVSSNLSGSELDSAVRHSGNAALHVVSSSAGTTQSSAIWQDIGPLETNAAYSVSFWYLPSTNGSGLTVRLSGSGISTTQNIAPLETPILLSTPGAPNSVPGPLPILPPVWINEIEPENVTGPVDDAGEHDPWVELYNAGSDSISLGGWYLADNYTNLTEWAFPPGTTIGANQRLVVWLDGQPPQTTGTSLHTDFRIPPTNGSLALVCPLGSQVAVLDYVDYSTPGSDRSFGLYPDGRPGPRRPFYLPTPGAPNTNLFAPLPVFINEWMAANTKTIADSADGHFDDWFELYNPNALPVDLAGYSLSDNPADATARWTIPTGVSIPARGFLLVWADNEPAQNSVAGGDLHAGFKLNKTGEAIALFGSDARLIDSVSYGAQTNDVSQGRWPDGGTNYYFMTSPSPDAPNVIPPVPAEFRILQVALTASNLTIFWAAEAGQTYKVQYRDDFSAGSWSDLTGVTATGPTGQTTVAGNGSQQRFYRIERSNGP
jgi:hypothetical protein